MPYAEPVPPGRLPVWHWRILAALLILGATGLHVCYLAWDCPLDLAPDEAHYWDWSRRLDWSYYSKGPLVAYLIRAGCELAGTWSHQLTGSPMMAVRLPAVLCGGLLLLSLYVLTLRVYGQERLAVAVVALALTLPLIAAGSSLMTIDAPFACCWGWALVLVHQAVFRRCAWAWVAAGVLVGLGILAKYTMIVWVPSVALFLLTSREQRGLLFRPGFWVMCGVAALCCVPILVWNAQHDWVSFWHVVRLSKVGEAMSDGPAVRWWGPLNYLGTQCALLLVFWFLAWVGAMIEHRPWVEPNAQVRYLWWMSAPMFAVFLLFSFKTGGGEPNWPVMAYLSGTVLTVERLCRRLPLRPAWQRRFMGTALALTCGVGVGLTVLVHHSEWVLPVVARIIEPFTGDSSLPLRKVDPSCRLRGWRTLAGEVDRVRAELRAGRGIEPRLASCGWTLPGELAFYCDGHPVVYSLGRAMGDRYSQYDFWHPNPLAEPEAFHGQTFIVVGYDNPLLREAFEEVEGPRLVCHYERGQRISFWALTVCHGFRGFKQLPGAVPH